MVDVDLDRPEWQGDAACRGQDPNLFHPHPTEDRIRERALRFCARCPVTAECLEFALHDPSLSGVWGGTSDRQRRRIRRQLGITVAAAPYLPDDLNEPDAPSERPA